MTWRLGFVGWMFFLHTTQGLNVPYIGSITATLNFVVISGLLSGIIGSLFVFGLDHVKLSFPKLRENMALTSGLFLIALVATYML